MRPLLLLVLSACSTAHRGDEPTPLGDAPPALPPLYAASADHGAFLEAARDAVRQGEVADALDLLRPLAGAAADPGLPPELTVYAHGLASEALDLQHVSGPEDAARIVGAAAAWCGRCHRAAGVPGPGEHAFDAHPYRRLADASWASLVWPEGPSWATLAGALAPHLHDAVPEGSVAPLSVLGRALKDVPIGSVARAGMGERVDVFAKVQASCDGCHRPSEEEAPVDEALARR